ncbi:hypothetical protein Q5P01_020433 [Channa striata]|uniref:Uncharacterized protein n=1 Tax=Channa striata TaxID=64152 RepID=A0AA88LXJ6_CHASR|nr:hypothetical protein Q5P01_020433 [Channa striata]
MGGGSCREKASKVSPYPAFLPPTGATQPKRVTRQRSQIRLDAEAEIQQSVQRGKGQRKRENMVDMALVMVMHMDKKLKTNMQLVLAMVHIKSDKSRQ